MVDLATLRGLVPSLARLPAVVYFHENQFDYPRHRQRHGLLEAQMVSLYSALAADSIVFNSAYNMDSFVAGCSALLHKLPDRVPAGVISILRDKASVLPVPTDFGQSVATEAAWPGQPRDLPGRPLRLLWVGRFEHDKGGDGLLRILLRLERDGLDYELAVIGQQFRSSPDVFRQIETDFSHRLVQFGYMDDPLAYRALLRGADVVLSTAGHEFQGLAVLQAVANGCLPVVPRRLAYPEIYPAQYCYDSNRDDTCLEACSAVRLIGELREQLGEGPVQAPDISKYSMQQLAPRYREALLAVAGVQNS
jgi:glycosyltransferase involved in cell wall biosynthesis